MNSAHRRSFSSREHGLLRHLGHWEAYEINADRQFAASRYLVLWGTGAMATSCLLEFDPAGWASPPRPQIRQTTIAPPENTMDRIVAPAARFRSLVVITDIEHVLPAEGAVTEEDKGYK